MSYNVGFDQAAGLRQLLGKRSIPYWAVVCALPLPHKQGVLLNLASALAYKGAEVFVLDAAPTGMGFADQVGCPPNLCLLPSQDSDAPPPTDWLYAPGIHVNRLIRQPIRQSADAARLTALSEQFSRVQPNHSFGLIDICPDYDQPLLLPALADAELMIVTAPNVPSVKQALALMQTLRAELGQRHWRLLVTDSNLGQARLIQQKLNQVASTCLTLPLQLAGVIPPDRAWQYAQLRGKSVNELYPNANSAIAFRKLATHCLTTAQQAFASSSTPYFAATASSGVQKHV